MAGIFISYRRADSDGWAGRLRDTLRVRFGDLVFQDVDNIPDGEIFSDIIDRALQECDVALVIIGPNWASAQDEHGRRRLDQDDDWVRTETAMVLNRKIRVIPVLVGGARLPRAEELPEELRSLTKRQAREIRSTSWDSDVALLTHQLNQIVQPRRRQGMARHTATAVGALLGAAVVAAGVYQWQRDPVPEPDQSAAAPTAPEPAMKRAEPSTKGALEAATRAPMVEAPAPAAKPETASKPAVLAERPQHTPRETARDTTPREPPQAPAPRPAETARPAPVKPAEVAKPAIAKAEAPKPASSSPAGAEKNDRVVPVRPPPPRLATAERPPASTDSREAGTGRSDTVPASGESRRAVSVAEEPPAERPAAAPAAQKAPAPTVARASTALNLPNRPASARELKIGDSWTYKLREGRFDREIATVTHEIGGGDPGGIRETVRLGTKRAAADADADSGGALVRATQRRLPLEPRIFEQPLSQSATLFEFAPFITAFSDLQPGMKWSKIAGATSSDSISDWRFSGRVTGRERVRVPAGTFEAIKAELEGQLDISFPSTRDPFSETSASYQTYSIWFVPEIGRAVKYERRTFNRGRRLLEHEQYELVSYQLK
jgi:hypothetical protein